MRYVNLTAAWTFGIICSQVMGWHLLFGLQRRWLLRCAILRPRNLTGVALAYKTTTGTVVTWYGISLVLYFLGDVDVHIHSGFASSHFFFRLRQVPQPVLVRLANCLFLFFASFCCCVAVRLGSVEFPCSNPPCSPRGRCCVAMGGMLPCT